MLRCDICLSRYGGPLGLCPECLVMTYPHGVIPTWVLRHTRRPALAAREHPVLQT